ncbi:hypothetical protein SAMN05421837_115174 [Amycolatopsis pretoriensis]|uniref:Uncharacterized protein n=1 Tax=Amycolatopsis pretoriensis TaxID=218821 RepID=A0A1H5RHG2_9PSEU|nr:hypothetical protein [Amycolatopsis pretoriensis]SEF37823.1 hypothetical protein SAMN05421837_115174 [Amycolatopsis pretoriensis]
MTCTLTTRLAAGCAAAAALLSTFATTASFGWLPLESPAVAAGVALTVHGALLLTIVDSHDRRLRGPATVVGSLLACFLLAGSLWTAAGHFPGQPGLVAVQVLENIAGPLAVLAVFATGTTAPRAISSVSRRKP